MSDTVLSAPKLHKRTIDLSPEERAQLNAVIDLLIPSDENFPPPSSLHLIDTFLHHLIPSMVYKTTVALNEKRLRTALRDLNASANGNFCGASVEKQHAILQRLEQRDPALFQALLTLANHSYYTQLATRQEYSSFM